MRVPSLTPAAFPRVNRQKASAIADMAMSERRRILPKSKPVMTEIAITKPSPGSTEIFEYSSHNAPTAIIEHPNITVRIFKK